MLARRLLPAIGGVAGRPVHFRLEGLQLAGLKVAVGYMYTGVVESGEAGAEDAVEVLLVAESLGLEPLVEAAVARVNAERAWLVKEPRFRGQMLGQPAPWCPARRAGSGSATAAGPLGSGPAATGAATRPASANGPAFARQHASVNSNKFILSAKSMKYPDLIKAAIRTLEQKGSSIIAIRKHILVKGPSAKLFRILNAREKDGRLVEPWLGKK